MAKRKLLQVVVLASIFAVTSCNDSSSNPDATDTLTSSDSTADIVDPNGLASSSSFTIDDNEILTPLSSDGNGLDIPVTSSDGNANPSSSMDSVSLDPTSSSNIEQTIEVSSNDGEKPTSSSAINEQNPASSTFDGQKPESSTGVEIKSSSSDAVIQSSSAQEVAETGIFLTEDKDETRGHIDIEYQQDNGPDGQSILAYPKQLSTTQKHAIVVWGPGGGEKPSKYIDMIKDLAGQGFVVIAIRESPGTGDLAIQAIDWLEKQNNDANSVFYGKLDMTKVGCSGHSMGGLESEQAAIKDERVITAFLNNSGDHGSGAFVDIPKTKTAGVVFGEKGLERSNAIRDYQSARETPVCMIEMTGGPMNTEGGWGHGSGPWDGRAITVAWMRWQLGGEDFRKADFVGTSGKYINGRIEGKQGNWKGECKNFN